MTEIFEGVDLSTVLSFINAQNETRFVVGQKKVSEHENVIPALTKVDYLVDRPKMIW